MWPAAAGRSGYLHPAAQRAPAEKGRALGPRWGGRWPVGDALPRSRQRLCRAGGEHGALRHHPRNASVPFLSRLLGSPVPLWSRVTPQRAREACGARHLFLDRSTAIPGPWRSVVTARGFQTTGGDEAGRLVGGSQVTSRSPLSCQPWRRGGDTCSPSL